MPNYRPCDAALQHHVKMSRLITKSDDTLHLATGTITSKYRLCTLRYQCQFYNILTLFSKQQQTIWLQNSIYMQLKILWICRYSFNESLVTTLQGSLKKTHLQADHSGGGPYTEITQLRVDLNTNLEIKESEWS